MTDGSTSDFNGPSRDDSDFRRVLECALDAFVLCDYQGRVIEWNTHAETMFGYSKDEVIGHPMAELIVPEGLRAAHTTGINRYLSTGVETILNKRVELVAIRKDGKEFPVELSITALTNDQGGTGKLPNPETVRFCAFIRDITDWRREERLKEKDDQRTRMRQLVATLDSSTSFSDAIENCLHVICDITGWPVGHIYLVDNRQQRLVPSNDWHLPNKDAMRNLRDVTRRTTFAKGEGILGTVWQTREPGMIADIEATSELRRAQMGTDIGVQSMFALPVVDGDELLGVLEFFHTERTKIDRHLMTTAMEVGQQLGQIIRRRRRDEQLARLAAIVASSSDAIIGKTLNGTIVQWNRGAEMLYGYTEEEVLGRPISLLLPEGQTTEEAKILSVAEGGDAVNAFEVRRLRRNGDIVEVELTVMPIHDSSGKLIGTGTIERDIGDHKRSERQLREAKDEAERANRTKGEFLANVSHELRTPMNAILGMTELSLSEPIPEIVRDYLTTAHDSAETLLALLNDILDFSRIEAGRFELEIEKFDIREAITSACRALSLRAHEKGLELMYYVESDVPQRLNGDPRRLRQILTNLVGNAIKFTEQGEIVVRVQAIRKGDMVSLNVSVTDTGIGIAKDDMDSIFDPFIQADASTTRRYTGTGLGLAICVELVKLMNGEIGAESEEGVGSRFHFTVFMEEASDDPGTGQLDVEDLRDLPVLVVDDNATNRQILTQMLTRWSMKPVEADGATQALEEIEKANRQGYTYQLLLVDALMPDVDGLTLVERLRADDRYSGSAILMLSSIDRQMLFSRAQELLIASLLEKPVSRSDLFDAIMAALQRPLDKRAQADITDVPVHLRVLVAEDTPANQKVVCAILQKRGHLPTVAHNGREAVEMQTSRGFDVVLMDVQMPTMDGIQATALIRDAADPNIASVPIVAMTAHALKGDRQRCLAAGMDAYIAKPIHAQKLLTIIERYGARDYSQLDDSADETTSQERAEPDKPAADLNAALELLGGDSELLADQIGFFIEDAPGLLQRLYDAMETNTPAEAIRAAHSLKGLAAGLFADRVSRTAASIEALLQQSKDDFSDAHTHKLTSLIETLSDSLADSIAFFQGQTEVG